MSTLYTFGCSFTRYHWPTWANIVGKEFDSLANYGQTGIGNRAIVERLSEMTVQNTVTSDDVVIVQWTDPHRHDMHIPHRLPMDGWFTGGSIMNNPYYSDEWKNETWVESSYVMHTLNFIRLATALLDSLPCRYYMTSMNDLTQDIDSFMWLDDYRPFLQTDKWLPPMKPFAESGPFPAKPFKKAVRNRFGVLERYVDVTDPHPSPLAHYEYANKYIAPKLGITLDYLWAKTADDSLADATVHEDIRDILIKKINWDNQENWVRGL